MFGKKRTESDSFVSIYLIYDPAVPDRNCKFSPPFFSVNDVLAQQALLETLRRHVTSFDELYKSQFRRMDLWCIGVIDLYSGKIIIRDRYSVCNVGQYLDQDFVKHYMKTVSYPEKSEVIS